MTNPMTSPYPRTSRYHGVESAVHRTRGGQEVPYLKPRLPPQPDVFTTVRVHEVREGDRSDVLADRYLGDAGQWWRIADANPVLDPRELTGTPGRRIRITLPEGVPGTAGQ
ncbi:LysM domain-containing protein [Amycolatopsis anabasis]|uniref:LysM domain-containing protein n=1 Tax=Amycolatopsis anabasis TaxID=1840409 RepID=UPI00131BAE38|nr:LysM domain-containing protein [Amycolatopsis anabasis]